MKKKRPSLKDIAEVLQVSTTTVSFVLNGKGEEKKISKQLIARVENYLKEINYKPNLVARSLRTGSSRVIVFMVEDISNYFFSKIGRIIEDIAYTNDYRVLFCSTENDTKRAQDLIQLFQERQVDGFIIVPPTGIETEIQNLIENDIPVVLFDRKIDTLDVDSVTLNNYEGATQITEHLIEEGYNNIAFITIDLDLIQMDDRRKGYLFAMEENNLKPNILEIPYEMANADKCNVAISQFLSDNPQIDSIFFATNYLAQNGLKTMSRLDDKLIKALGLACFDDNIFFEMYSPSITTFAQPIEQMGAQLMKIMLGHLEDKEKIKTKKAHILEGKLIKRESSLRRETIKL
ncbi:LacI family DNA-binding transcriptional regulator [Leeuwenhoekiella sp. MAR_2009_132]|uniref:LacI family DNA-binding transcriptional regulator n=1 Tax=Leeuwenhoekiella sp. MAR_2009_132 TaxID=1392489 RepID=UPI0004919383|nr:LacI family DNA-binding transcriptional regulator [Leeuwenhoekiella sp. MAR_2009_132]